MTQAQNVAIESSQINSSGVLLTTGGGTGLSTVGTNGQVLTSNGTTLSWATPAASTTFQTSLSGLTPSTATSGTVTLAGTLGVASGGTGLTTLTAGYIPYGNGTSAFSSSSTLFFDGYSLGLGLTPSAWPTSYHAFEFGSNSTATGGLFSNGTNDTWFVSNAYFNGTNWVYKATGTATGYEQVSGRHIWSNAASGTAAATFSFTERMRLDSSGNLGIGTSSPAAKLDVTGGVITRAGPGSIAVAWFGDIATANWLTSQGGYNLTFFNDTSSGNLGTGTVSANSTTFYPKAAFGKAGNLNLAGAIYNVNARPMLNQTGGILQVVGFSTATTTSTSSGSYVSTTLSASITPSSTSSQIIVMAYCPYYVTNGGSTYYETYGVMGVFRNSTNLEEEQVGWSLSGNGQTKDVQGAWTPVIVDSPSTTSSVNYNVQIKTGSSNFSISLRNTSLYAGSPTNNNPRLLLMEVAG